MGFVLTCQLGERQLRFTLAQGESVVGSDPASELHLAHPSVSRRHALVHVGGGGVELQDLGSENGTFIGAKRLTGRRPIAAGTLLRFGSIRALLEEVADGDLRAAVALRPRPMGVSVPAVPAATTVSDQALDHFILDRLPFLLRLVGEGERAVRVAQEVGALLSRAVPCHRLVIWQGEEPRRALLFRWERAAEGAGDRTFGRPATSYRAGDFVLEIEYASPPHAVFYAPLAAAGIELVRLCRPVGALPSTAQREARPAAPHHPEPNPPSLAPAVAAIYSQARRVAPGRIGVLILGESGTGKDILARFLHAASGLPSWVALNCAALPRDLLEAELFGIERGVATGVEPRPGKFELADGGTLFLDEIGDMSLETQAKILRVLELGEVHRLGGREPRPARVRVVAATNCDLNALVEAGRFRRDLFHRIADWTVTLPPLRERRADIPHLAAHFLAQESARLGKPLYGISEAAMDALTAYPWPGNIRQLEREIARAALFLDPGDLLDTSRLSPDIAASRPASAGHRTLEETLLATERREIEAALATSSGDTANAAAQLGIGRSTLYRRMVMLGIEAKG